MAQGLPLALAFVVLAACVCAVPVDTSAEASSVLLETGTKAHDDPEYFMTAEVPSPEALDADAAANNDPAGDCTGCSKNIPNMVGAPYGLPGYKESHDWTTDVDIFSPVVFDWEFYAAGQGITGGETATKQAWADFVNDDSIHYPNCHQGSSNLNPNSYQAANLGRSTQWGSTSPSCGTVIKDYLKEGLFEGLSTGGIFENTYVIKNQPINGRNRRCMYNSDRNENTKTNGQYVKFYECEGSFPFDKSAWWQFKRPKDALINWEEDDSKMFLYNWGTKQFLRSGSWWNRVRLYDSPLKSSWGYVNLIRKDGAAIELPLSETGSNYRFKIMGTGADTCMYYWSWSNVWNFPTWEWWAARWDCSVQQWDGGGALALDFFLVPPELVT